MKKYDEIFQEILTLPETFVATDIMDKERVALNHMIKRREKNFRGRSSGHLYQPYTGKRRQ